MFHIAAEIRICLILFGDLRGGCSSANLLCACLCRHHTWLKEGHKEVTLTEVGPRFELKPYQIVLGTIDMIDAQIEWVLRPYMNTAKKRKVL